MNTLVLIRGWASVEYSFKKFLETKPKNWNILLFGADELIKNGDMDQAAEKLEKIIQSKKLAKFVLAGHSLGGALAITYSAKYPQTHSKLILVNTVGSPLPGSFLKETLKMIFRNSQKTVKHWPLKVVEGINIIRNPAFHIKLGKFARSANVLEYANLIDKPVLILYGDEDRLVPLETSKAIHKQIKQSKLKVLKDYDHDWIQNHPEIFWKYLRQISG
jgi:pimeloyl-ACP methyl ester carboxylesterase